MKPDVDYLLDEVVHLPDWDEAPKDADGAIAYMAQWDTGEYSHEQVALSSLYKLHGYVILRGEYVLFRSFAGDETLYRKASICHAYELRQIDAWSDGEGGWTWNESWHLRDVHVAEDKEADFLLELVAASAARHTVEADGNGLYELQEVDSGRPLFAILPIIEEART